MEHFPHVFQPSYNELIINEFHLQGNWSAHYFGNNAPITLELGCGKGEYTVSLAEIYPQRNFIGIDIKGARMFTGAKYALENKLKNVAFIRTRIENIDSLFGSHEISEIWLTFPDPQMKKERKRLTSTWFLYRYRNLLKPDGIIHLKTDSGFLFSYTCALVHLNNFKILAMTDDLYQKQHSARLSDEALKLQTYYEKQWTERGIPIKYLSFMLNDDEYFSEPSERFEKDNYRSFGRGAIQTKEHGRLL